MCQLRTSHQIQNRTKPSLGSQEGNEYLIGFASRAISKAVGRYVAHGLKFLALKWAVTESVQEYLYGNTFAVYSYNNPLTCMLTTAKRDATGHRWIACLAQLNFTVY